MKHREQTWSGTDKIGDPTGRKLLHHLHNNGGNTNTKTLNGKINIGGKSGYRSFQSHVDFSQISRTDISECRARVGRAKTEHLVARIFSHCCALDHRLSHELACGSSLGCVAPLRILQSHPLTTCFIDHSLTCFTDFHHFVPRHLRFRRPLCL